MRSARQQAHHYQHRRGLPRAGGDRLSRARWPSPCVGKLLAEVLAGYGTLPAWSYRPQWGRGRQGTLTPTLSRRERAWSGDEPTTRQSVSPPGCESLRTLLQFLPGFSSVCTHVDVAIEARRSDYVGPLRVRREPVDDRVWLYWQLDGLPRLTTILGALDRASDPWDRVAIPNEDDIRVISLQHDTTTVRAVICLVELGEIVILPVLPSSVLVAMPNGVVA